MKLLELNYNVIEYSGSSSPNCGVVGLKTVATVDKIDRYGSAAVGSSRSGKLVREF